MAAFENETLNWPRFAAVKTSPDGALNAAVRAVAVAVNQYVAAFHGKTGEAGHAAVVRVLRSVRKGFAKG